MAHPRGILRLSRARNFAERRRNREEKGITCIGGQLDAHRWPRRALIIHSSSFRFLHFAFMLVCVWKNKHRCPGLSCIRAGSLSIGSSIPFLAPLSSSSWLESFLCISSGRAVIGKRVPLVVGIHLVGWSLEWCLKQYCFLGVLEDFSVFSN